MEESGSPREDSKNSSEEADKNDEFTRSVRSYECVFCKRGFTTAQALGGHMNIHRKHRAPKINPNYYCPSDDHHHHHQVFADGHEGSENFRPFLANIQDYPKWNFGHDDNNQVRVNNNKINSSTDTYSTSTSTITTRPSDLLRENWGDTSLNLGIVTTRNEEDGDNDHNNNNNKEKIIIGDFREDHMDVDLELRLGYDH